MAVRGPSEKPRRGPEERGQAAAKQQEMRVAYNKNTHRFEPIKKGDGGKLNRLAQMEQKVERAKRILPDATSPNMLKRQKIKTQSTGKSLKTSTKGVAAFFKGDAKKFDQFLSSIDNAGLT